MYCVTSPQCVPSLISRLVVSKHVSRKIFHGMEEAYQVYRGTILMLEVTTVTFLVPHTNQFF